MWERFGMSLCFFVAFLLGGGLVYFVDGYWYDKYEIRVTMPCDQQYPFLSPLLDCKDIEEKFSDIENLGKSVERIIEDEKQAGNILRGSFFYRDLNTRRFVGVNEADQYNLASLTKLPIAMIYYKLAEVKLGFLDLKFSLTEEHLKEDVLQSFKPDKKLLAGEYSARELIHYMLIYSQNAAARALYSEPTQVSETVFSDLGIYIPSGDGYGRGTWNATTRTFGNILRVLYNASYLDAQKSNEVLEILSQSVFEGGIAKVPEGVRVAHKFGEATRTTPEGKVLSRVLNHCGIVYKPGRPYIVCIMVEGNDFDEEKRVIERIAETVYDHQ